MIVEVRVSTNSPKPGVEAFGKGLKVRVKAKPKDGEANSEVVTLLAQYFRVEKGKIRILSGFSSKKKVIEVLF
jgi:uncharacterized protein (TIGR00251 family)